MNYDPVDKHITNLVFGIDKDYISNHRNIFNKVNSYLRPALNQKNISEHMVKQATEATTQASSSNAQQNETSAREFLD